MKAVLLNQIGQIGHNFNHKIPDNFVGIQSLGEFTYKYRTKKGNLNKQYLGIYNKLIQLSSNLNNYYGVNIDPIVYIHYLYYGEGKDKGMSLKDLGKRILNLGIDLGDSKTIWKLLSNNLEFPLRDRHQGTEIKNKKDKTKASQLEIHKISREETKKQVEDLLSISQDININIELSGTKREKMIQILFKGNILETDNIYELTILIQGLYQQGLGAKRIVQVFHQVLDSIYPGHGIKLDSKEINYWSKLKPAN